MGSGRPEHVAAPVAGVVTRCYGVTMGKQLGARPPARIHHGGIRRTSPPYCGAEPAIPFETSYGMCHNEAC